MWLQSKRSKREKNETQPRMEKIDLELYRLRQFPVNGEKPTCEMWWPDAGIYQEDLQLIRMSKPKTILIINLYIYVKNYRRFFAHPTLYVFILTQVRIFSKYL